MAGSRAPQPDVIEVPLTLSPGQYKWMGSDLERLRKQFDLPGSASNTKVTLEAVQRQASLDESEGGA
jgi:hypothetical protein